MKPKEPKPLPEYEFITPDDYKKFQRIIKEEYGKDISYDEAVVMAKRLLSLYELMARPIPKDATAGRDDKKTRPADETSPLAS